MTDKLSHRVLVGGQRQIVTASPVAEKAECEGDCPGGVWSSPFKTGQRLPSYSRWL